MIIEISVIDRAPGMTELKVKRHHEHALDVHTSKVAELYEDLAEELKRQFGLELTVFEREDNG